MLELIWNIDIRTSNCIYLKFKLKYNYSRHHIYDWFKTRYRFTCYTQTIELKELENGSYKLECWTFLKLNMFTFTSFNSTFSQYGTVNQFRVWLADNKLNSPVQVVIGKAYILSGNPAPMSRYDNVCCIKIEHIKPKRPSCSIPNQIELLMRVIKWYTQFPIHTLYHHR